MMKQELKRGILYVYRGALAAFLFASVSAPISAQDAQPLTAQVTSSGVTIFIGDPLDEELILRYNVGPEWKFPYFYPVNGPATGESVTTETSEPYPHHRSLYFGCDHVNGGNYWQEGLERGQIVSKYIFAPETKGNRIHFKNVCEWQRPGAPSPFRDVRRVTVTAPSPTLRVIDFEIELEALIDVQIGRTNHSLFAARVIPELSVNAGGVMVDSEGRSGEAETLGRPARWMSYGGEREGIFEAVAIFDHPSNPWHPSPWFTRDYGFFSPTPLNWLEEGLSIPQGETLNLRYRVVVHQGTHAEADLEGLYQRWIEE